MYIISMMIYLNNAGQANGIFELKSGKTYFLSGAVAPFFGAANDIDLVWFDITNTTELGRRSRFSDAVLAMNQPKCEITFTPLTDVTVELRLVAATTPANLNGYDSEHTFANIFEFSGKNGADGAPGTGGSNAFKDPVRAKTLADVSNLGAFTVVTDGVTLIENDRVLLTEQTSPAQNGIYTLGVVAAGLAPLTRSQDMDVTTELIASIIVMVEEGSTKKNTMWQLTSNNPLTIGVSPQVWEEFKSGGAGPPGSVGSDGLDASGEFIGDGRQFQMFDNVSKLQGFRNLRGPQGNFGDLILIPNDGYDHGDFGGPPPPAELNPQEVLVTVGAPSGSAFGGNTNSSRSLNYGETWVANSQLADRNWGTLVYDPIGRILLCIAGQTTINLGISTDKGESWGSSTKFGSDSPADIIWVESLSLFIVVTSSFTGNAIWTSPDGSTWTNRTTAALTPIPTTTAARSLVIVYSPFLGKIFAFGPSAFDFLSSTDGITWIKENYVDVLGNIDAGFTLLQTPRKVIWSEGQRQFVMINSNVKTLGVFISSDGKTWVASPPVSTLISNAPEDLIWVPNYSTWIMAGGFSQSPFSPMPWAISSDALTWIPVPPKEFRSVEVDFDESFLAQPGGADALAFSPSFGYIFGFGGSPNTITNDFRNTSFTRTQVYFNGLAAGNVVERDFGSPR